MFRQKNFVLLVMAALLLPGFAIAQAPDAAAISKIKDEGMTRSQALATIRYLTDVIGPRLTNSPAQRRANNWTKEQLEKWGMKNAAVDPWGEFGRGWELERFTASVEMPEGTIPFRAYPKAWSPSTNGPLTGTVVYVDAADEAGLEKYKGKLKGAIIFTQSEREIKPGFQAIATRNSDEDLAKMESAKPQAPAQRPQPNQQAMAEMRFNQRKTRFYYEEGAAMLVDAGGGVDAGTIRVMGASLPPAAAPAGGNPFAGGVRVYSKNAPATIPQVVAEAELYNRVLRMVKQGIPVKMTVDLATKFYDDDTQGYNTIAEIPGTDLKDEVVMIGAHLDSWHAGTGATDNGAGVTVVMEAMRILAASGLKPRRTIRVGLWTGEEQGLLGSRGYVAKYLATLGDGSDAAAFGGGPRKITPKPAHDKFAAYYNLDNGTGQIRGIYMQGNEALRPIFKSWLEPFGEWSASTVTVNNTSGTDHLAFDAVGLPGFQFIQDPVEYFGRTWHTTQDVADRILEEDLKRSAVIMATFAFNSAMTDQKLPRKSQQTAQIFPGLQQLRAVMDEVAFRESGYGFSICGGELHHDEIPHGFPAFLTVMKRDDIHAAE
ncbi:MAG: M20/M25/M40 family metallo-hydrolase [Pyrinomonadaceae bacterium]|nr:M20/M25/M40 family metallo-hydrolase [Pyrinomonadaceae bacterium]